MFKDHHGQLHPSVLMIDQERDNLNYFSRVFCDGFPQIKFFMAIDPDFGVACACQYQPDVIITEVYYPRYDYYDGETVIENQKRELFQRN